MSWPGGPAPAAPKEPPHGALLLRLRRWGEPFHLVLWGLAAALCGAGAAGLLPGGPHLQPGLPAPGGAAAGFPHHPLWLSDERPPPNPGGRHCPPAQRAVLRLPRRGELLQRTSRPEGFEVVSGPALELWSQRLLENWNLYKAERQRKAPAGKAPPKAVGGFTQAQLEAEGRRVAQLYESSTSWKVTKPPAGPAGLWKGKAGHAGQPEK